MKAEIRTFWFPKAGSSVEEYEDGFAPSDVEVTDERRISCAVTDGATEGMLSGQWARVVAETFVELLSIRKVVPKPSTVVNEARSRWPRSIELYRQAREDSNRPLRWYEEEKLTQGSFATVVALQLTAGEPALLRAYAVGDACLFQVRDGQHFHSFPLTRLDEFGSNPSLFRSSGGPPEVRVHSGTVLTDDSFYLCSDAAAHWVTRLLAEGDVNPFEVVDSLDRLSQDERNDWLNDLRAEQSMRNDDVTIMRVTVYDAR